MSVAEEKKELDYIQARLYRLIVLENEQNLSFNESLSKFNRCMRLVRELWYPNL